MTIITPTELRLEPLILNLAIPAGAIEYAPDVRQAGPLAVKGLAERIEEHGGPKEIIEDIRLRATYSGTLELLCARCVEPMRKPLRGEFDLIFRPAGTDAHTGEHALSEAETEIGYYEESGLVLEDVVREQVLLSLPDRSLCTPGCKGLCPHCGQNRNEKDCQCESAIDDPRWSALKDLADSIKQPKP